MTVNDVLGALAECEHAILEEHEGRSLANLYEARERLVVFCDEICERLVVFCDEICASLDKLNALAIALGEVHTR